MITKNQVYKTTNGQKFKILSNDSNQLDHLNRKGWLIGYLNEDNQIVHQECLSENDIVGHSTLNEELLLG